MRTFYRICTVAAVAVAVCFVSWTSVLAQPSFELGVKLGLGLAKLSGDDTKETSFLFMDLGDGFYAEGQIEQDFGGLKLGFVGGGYAAVHVTENFGVRVEGLYFKKGGKGDNTGQIDVRDEFDNLVGSIDVSGENTVTLDYFEFPFLGVISFPVGEMGTFDIFAGPVLAFNINAEIEQEITLSAMGASETVTETVDISDEVKGADFGGLIGAGLTFDLGQVMLFGEARWEYGFTQVIDDGDEDEDIKNMAFGFIAGVGIPLGKSE